MIKIHLAIYDNEIDLLTFENYEELIDYIEYLVSFNCIWLMTSKGEYSEIIVTEKIDLIINSLVDEARIWKGSKEFYIQEYQSFEDAYAVALDMREGHKKCYNV